MQPIQIILDDAPEHIDVPDELQHQKVEVTFKVLDSKVQDLSNNDVHNIDNICGILNAPKSVSLEQMDNAIKLRGSHL